MVAAVKVRRSRGARATHKRIAWSLSRRTAARHPSPPRPRAPYDSGVGAPTALVMAAGEGTRMRSSLPKPLHTVCGRPMIAWPILAAEAAGAERIAVIVSPGRDLSAALPPGTESVVQPEADGTGGAVRAAEALIRDAETVLVLSGDHPLVTGELIGDLIAAHEGAGAGATVMTAELDDPGSYGRIVRGPHRDIEQIVEAKSPGDATPAQLKIREITTGTYAFSAALLLDALGKIGNENSQGEYFLGDVLPIIRAAGHRVEAHLASDPSVNLGVNTRADLAVVESKARERILDAHMRGGVTITDPGSTWIEADVGLEADARIDPGTTIRGSSTVGAGSVVGPHTTLIDSRIGREVTVPHSYLVDCDVLDRCTVGPFAYIRPGTKLGEGSKAGTFVEIKNSDVGAGSKVPHLSYVGDTEIGEDSNIGAGAITANYDGYRKHRTVIGDRVQIGVGTALVAPVDVGDAAYTGAGSVITKNVPPGALGISRAQQRKIEGYAERRAREASEEGEES